MTLQPPLYLQGSLYSARVDRQLIADIFDPGVRGAADMLVTSSGGSLSVNIASGVAIVYGNTSSNQGAYRVFNDAVFNLAFDRAVTFPRLDQVVVHILDPTEGAGSSTPAFEIAKGVEATGASLINRSGANPTLPSNSLLIADVLVPVGVSPVIPAININDRRTMAAHKGGGVLPIGSQVPWVGTVDPGDGVWVLGDGRLIDRWTYTKFFNFAGHAYNGGVDPGNNKVRIPDKRGRSSIGAPDFGTAAGAATGNARAQAARGLNGGEVAHTQTMGELAPHAHTVSLGSTVMNPGNTPVEAVGATGGHAGTFGITQNQGGGGAHNNLHPYEADFWIVRIA